MAEDFRPRRAKKKKDVPTWNRLPKFIHPILIFLILVSSLALLPKDIWLITRRTFILPLNQELFEWVFGILGGYRLVLSPLVLQPTLLALTFLGPFALGAVFLLAHSLIPGAPRFRVLMAAIICVPLAPYALPGEAPAVLTAILVSILALLPVMRTKLTPLQLWMIFTLGALFSLGIPQLRPLVFWGAASFGLSSSINFLLVNRGRTIRAERKYKLGSVFSAVGISLLLIWLYTLMIHLQFNPEHLGPSTHYWIAFLGGSLCALASLLMPWKTRKWLGAGVFFQGALLFQTLDIALWVCMAWVSLHILECILNTLTQSIEDSSRKLLLIPQMIAIFVCVGLVVGTALTTQRERRFDTDWISVLDRIHEQNESAYLVITEAWPFWAQFSKADFIQDNSLLFEGSEDLWIEHLNHLKTSGIIIDTKHLKELWADSIKKGQKPEDINRSVLSRLVLYNGESINTKTMKAPAIERLKIEKILPTESFVMVTTSGK